MQATSAKGTACRAPRSGRQLALHGSGCFGPQQRHVACCASARTPANWAQHCGKWLALGAAAVLLASPLDAEAARGKVGLPPIDPSDKGRCEVAALDKFADTRAAFRSLPAAT